MAGKVDAKKSDALVLARLRKLCLSLPEALDAPTSARRAVSVRRR